jgi:hypothetical protein
MAKAIEIDGVLYRKRRGKLVKIPEEWVGKTISHHAKSKRHSKTKAKRIYTGINRAKEKDQLRNNEDPNPAESKQFGRWHYCSGRTDKYRNKHKGR